jgi:23S rRNA (cytosine1962-C5)-methyltransferase
MKKATFMRDLLQEAIDRRSAIDFPDTNAYRLVDSEGDGLSGLTIDRFGPVWLASEARSREPSPELLAEMPAVLGVNALWWKYLDREEKTASPRCLWSRAVGGEYRAEPSHLQVRENAMVFEIDLAAGYSQGIFLDQRLNRRWISKVSEGRSVLNLFAYTCGFSVAVARGGGVATSLDLSQSYLDWGRRNFAANEIDDQQHHWCRGDAFEWLARFARSGRRFGGVILDPPTFSHSGRGRDRRLFRVENDLGVLVEMAAEILEPGGFLLVTTNCRRLSQQTFASLLVSRLGGEIEWVPMPPEYRGEQYLKTARWVA